MYRVDGRQVRETLSTLARVPNVANARRRSLASLEKARAGVNPVAERRTTTMARQDVMSRPSPRSPIASSRNMCLPVIRDCPNDPW